MPQEIVIRLSSGYPRRQLDRLLRQLEPVLCLDAPAIVHLDLDGLVFLGPTAQAVVAAAFHRIISDGLAGDGSRVVMPRAPNVLRYLSRMDFFEPIVGPLPEDFERHEPTGFRPLQHYTSSGPCYSAALELRNAMSEACHLDDTLAGAALHVCLAELAENVLFHSGATYGGFAAAQGWQKRGEVEVAIVDMGVGIRGSLGQNVQFAEIADDVTAIETALEPMVTATPDRNTGLGLSLTRFLLRRNGGELMVRSGEGAVYAGTDERSETRDVPFPGTIVSLTALTEGPFNIQDAYADLDAAGYKPRDD